MKVCNACAKHPDNDGRVYDKISITLKERGFEVHNTSPNVNSRTTSDGIQIHGFRQDKGLINRVISLFRLHKVIRQINPDVIFAHEPDALLVSFIYSKLARREPKVKLTFDCHEAYEHWFDRKTKYRVLNNLMNWGTMSLINLIIRRIDNVTSVNQTMTERFRVINPKSYMLPSVSAKANNIDCIPDNRMNEVVYFGQFGQSNQQEILIEAAKRIKEAGHNLKISIIGGQKREVWQQSRFMLNAQEHKVEDFFIDYGWLARENAFKLLPNYSVGIMRFDSNTMPGNFAMPNKLFEYMASGLAILACELNVEVAAIIRENECGILIPNETGESLAEALLWVADHPKEVALIGDNSLKAVKQKYNWDVYGDLLESIVSGNNTI